MFHDKLLDESTGKITKILPGDIITYKPHAQCISIMRKNPDCLVGRVLFCSDESEWDDKEIFEMSTAEFRNMVKLIAVACGLGVQPAEGKEGTSAFEFTEQKK